MVWNDLDCMGWRVIPQLLNFILTAQTCSNQADPICVSRDALSFSRIYEFALCQWHFIGMPMPKNNNSRFTIQMLSCNMTMLRHWTTTSYEAEKTRGLACGSLFPAAVLKFKEVCKPGQLAVFLLDLQQHNILSAMIFSMFPTTTSDMFMFCVV